MGHQRVLIFCHYGVSRYLKITLGAAKKTSGHEVVLLGDQSNKHIAESIGVKHYNFHDELFQTDKVKKFKKSFTPIAGKSHPNTRNNGEWLKFVFLRWFYIENLLKILKVDTVYHFDTDVLILKDLQCDYFPNNNPYGTNTTQCNGMCLNGIVSAVFVEKYTDAILKIFSDKAFINDQKKLFNKADMNDKAFTEMRAFLYCCDIHGIKLPSLNEVDETGFHDECFAQVDDEEKPSYTLWYKHKTYQLINGNWYYKRKLVKTVNLSWLPTGMFYLIAGRFILSRTYIFRSLYCLWIRISSC